MPTDTVFGQNSTDNVETASTDQSVLDTLVGEGKKYADLETLAKSRMEADEFIKKLQEETAQGREIVAELQAKLESSKKIDDVVSALDKPQAQRQETPSPQVDESYLDELIGKKLSQKERDNLRLNNLKKANDEVVSAFGSLEKATQAVVDKAKVLGMAPKEMSQIAEKSPSAFLQIMGLNKSKETSTTSMSSGTVNTEAHQHSNASGIQPGTHAWYENLRKADPYKYLKPAVQNAMFKDRKEKGDSFYS